MIDHCIAFVEKRGREKVLTTYVTDALMAISKNTAKRVDGGVYVQHRYMDIVSRKLDDGGNDSVSARSIVDNIKSKVAKIRGDVG